MELLLQLSQYSVEFNMTHEEMMRRHAEERIPKPETAAFTLWRGGSLGIPNAFFGQHSEKYKT